MKPKSGIAIARELWDEMKSSLPPYPAGVAAVPEPIERTAFFPGGLGLWMEGHDVEFEFPTGQCMVVGQDFNTVKTYCRAREAKSEINSSRTWQILRRLLATFSIPMQSCFYTNAYMGLRASGPETGRFPGAHDAPFVDRCSAFFARQLAVAQPKLILMLGMEPLRVLGPRLFRIKSPRMISVCETIYAPLRFGYGNVAVVVLTHPSLYHANVGRRRYGGFAGVEAERAMVRDAKTAVAWGTLREVGHESRLGSGDKA